ncbi:Aste57867_3307 [Aphanomyces stellatus]|uniref:Aste57867_3307 protein n=1 Tax=Aphanomyces stellatus TaxID=120398 RepID=A0A485KAG2_9STRA|nr:hypothetical protein As57867_003297 [Aphanomyces stellatus]VFT80477.1 Aste57867_3307 [Aphanomyces stellatus]
MTKTLSPYLRTIPLVVATVPPQKLDCGKGVEAIVDATHAVHRVWTDACTGPSRVWCSEFTNSLVGLYNVLYQHTSSMANQPSGSLTTTFAALHHALLLSAFSIVLSDRLANGGDMDTMRICGRALMSAVDGVREPDLHEWVVDECEAFLRGRWTDASMEPMSLFFSQTKYLASFPHFQIPRASTVASTTI